MPVSVLPHPSVLMRLTCRTKITRAILSCSKIRRTNTVFLSNERVGAGHTTTTSALEISDHVLAQL